MEEIEKIKSQIKTLKAKVKRLEDNKFKNGDTMYWLDDIREIKQATYDSKDATIDYILKCNKVFKTETQTSEYRGLLNAIDMYTYKFSIEELENPHIEKYELTYNIVTGFFDSCPICNMYEVGELTFKTEDDAINFARNYGRRMIKYMF